MHFYYADIWDKGDFYSKNQDSFGVQMILTGSGPCAMAVICDGVGGLAKGEYASGYVALGIINWFYEHALHILCSKKRFSYLKGSFQRALNELHQKLVEEGKEKKICMGTTISVLLLWGKRFYVFHVGDCRCYKIGARNVLLTREQINDKGELLGAVGVGEMPAIYIKRGWFRNSDTFLLCSDGFGRCLSKQGIQALRIQKRFNVEDKRKIMQEVIHRGRWKGERDNCTGILLKKL